MWTAKKPRFDPASQRAKFRARHILIEGVAQKAKAFISTVREAALCSIEELEYILSSLDPQSEELVLVALLGLEGVDCEHNASQMVPQQFPRTDRLGYVVGILNAVISTPMPDGIVSPVMAAVERLSYYQHHIPPRSYMSALRSVSQATGIAQTAFLAPPVFHCIMINATCKEHFSAHAFARPHPPTMHGDHFHPRWATPSHKDQLKCRECNNIMVY